MLTQGGKHLPGPGAAQTLEVRAAVLRTLFLRVEDLLEPDGIRGTSFTTRARAASSDSRDSRVRKATLLPSLEIQAPRLGRVSAP
jgi:hypothetical protein